MSQYFEKVAAKRLSAVEVSRDKSHQHEFNGSKELRSVLGTDSGEKRDFKATFIWFGREDAGLTSESVITWYDARKNHPTRSEFRLYFPDNEVMTLASEGDTIFIAKRRGDSLMIIVAQSESTIENQLLWLFALTSPAAEENKYELSEIGNADRELDFPVRYILDELGIDIEEPETDFLDSILERYKGVFPITKAFSAIARSSLNGVNAIDDPDYALMAWMNHEEKLFRRLERHIIEKRLKNGFMTGEEIDVDAFLSFSMSVHQRRKSRAGYALENHLEEIFMLHNIHYSRGKETENKAKPDFLFPGHKEYHDQQFPPDMLTCLGVKTTCKDRWRQVLSEARRINGKHLLTLEPGISENQTDEMRGHALQLVLPAAIFGSYSANQRAWLMSVIDFIKMLATRRKRIIL